MKANRKIITFANLTKEISPYESRMHVDAADS